MPVSNHRHYTVEWETTMKQKRKDEVHCINDLAAAEIVANRHQVITELAVTGEDGLTTKWKPHQRFLIECRRVA